MAAPKPNAIVRVLRADPAVIQEALDALDAAGRAGNFTPVRSAERYDYRIRSLIIEIPQPGGDSANFSVPTRNLSREGISFIVGQFLYPGTECKIHLVSLYNYTRVEIAVVMRCRYLPGTASLHEVGAKFKDPIDIELFHRSAACTRLLLVDDDPSFQRIAQQLLKSMNVELTSLTEAGAAIESAINADFDVILMDVDLPGKSGIDAVRELREQGYARPIVAVTAHSDEQTKKRCLEAGCNVWLSKPVSRDSLTTVISSLKEEPIVSSLVHDRDMGELIDEFVGELGGRVRELESSLVKQDLKAVEAAARRLKGEGSTYGFDIITDAAAQLEGVFLRNANPGTADIRQKLSQLVRVCLAARPASSSAKPTFDS